jgi:hypothetical protein
MIYVNSITAALTGILSADAALVSSGFSVQEGEALNRDLHLTPWVGVYHGHLAVAPLTVGGDAPWQGNVELILYVQEGSHLSGQDANRRLNMAQGAVLDVLRQNPTLNGAVLAWLGLEIAPFRRDLVDDTWLFTNEIVLKAQVRA